VEEICDNDLVKVQDGNHDEWSYIWGSNIFMTQKAYEVMMEYQPAQQFKWFWKYSCQAKHKNFFWFLLHEKSARKENNCHLPSHLYYFCNAERRKRWYTCSGHALLLKGVGILFVRKEQGIYLLWKPLLIVRQFKIVFFDGDHCSCSLNNKIFNNQRPILRVGKLFFPGA
jgi:hypothetical protein